MLKWKIKRSLVTLLAVTLLVLTGVVASTARAQNVCGANYTVVYGDTLREIASRCNTSVSAILAANPSVTNPNRIYIGQRLNLPTPAEQVDSAFTYTVRPGDTLYRIAARFETTVPRLLQANPSIRNRNLIYPNQQLTIPAPQAEDQAKVTISPTSGPPGTVVELVATDFPPNIPVEIGIGLRESEYTVHKVAWTNAAGTVRTQVTIPESADPRDPWVAVVTPAEPMLKAVSNPFLVTQEALGSVGQ